MSNWASLYAIAILVAAYGINWRNPWHMVAMVGGGIVVGLLLFAR